ncbi:hypothetical protein Rhopal_001359-T1 [Rhodotorula paludigena]|uniref:DNA damage-binding protein CMR1 n=1 Tax=Rhodotorula paludigena TaxID=86838 RepID=A0AAV5GE39_9BASI|nr:hypothetical protein Rhopal_001359-T1 [Rhodotorula paludigena]
MADLPSFDFNSFLDNNAATQQELLKESGLTDAVDELKQATASTASAARSKRAPATKKRASTAAGTKRKAADADLGDAPVTRRSTRSMPSRQAKTSDPDEKRKLEEAAEAEARALAAEEDRLRHADRAVEAFEGGTQGAGSTASLLDEFAGLALYDVKAEDGVPKWELSKRPKAEGDKLKKLAAPWDLRAIVKVIPERIYSMAVHPDPQRDLVFVGDKHGHMALWDCTDAGKLDPSYRQGNGSVRDGKPADVGDDGDEDDEDAESPDARQWGKWWHWKAHGRNCVSAIKFRPGERKSVYSSCYDHTLRVQHFDGSGISEEVLDARQFDTDDPMLHSFDFDPTGNELWAVDHDGGLIWRDLRMAKDKAKRWNIDRYKVGCISINPANPNLIATAHLKRTMNLWDLKKIRGLDPDTDYSDVIEAAQLAQYESKYACSSAYFDPTGTRLASTSYDDRVRIWDVEPASKTPISPNTKKDYAPQNSIVHNCQVGRYTTVLRAHWNASPSLPPHVYVGDMQKYIRLYSPDAPSTSKSSAAAKTFDGEGALTAVPAVTAAHPSVPGKYFGGASSGKVSFWTEMLPDGE